jgi:predicted methyltransferase MtxX (methanogen marker protein 4)
VSCVYKGNQEHKPHKIKPLEKVEKTIEFEIIKNEEKSKSLVNQLNEIKE